MRAFYFHVRKFVYIRTYVFFLYLSMSWFSELTTTSAISFFKRAGPLFAMAADDMFAAAADTSVWDANEAAPVIYIDEDQPAAAAPTDGTATPKKRRASEGGALASAKKASKPKADAKPAAERKQKSGKSHVNKVNEQLTMIEPWSDEKETEDGALEKETTDEKAAADLLLVIFVSPQSTNKKPGQVPQRRNFANLTPVPVWPQYTVNGCGDRFCIISCLEPWLRTISTSSTRSGLALHSHHPAQQ